ncbi:hypothetical protein N7533_007631 [Penicillium manginii]|uniref:uncharacterized protein n=1 Tax=Penicillium manginii TaxID=203109 RepID=UPI0025487267|nr:uncharacterized protein N7533_007631 [Penicillium manginii]KAJ5750603.1 hypothetical protein N7533_007631 [Penicillium manginii]
MKFFGAIISLFAAATMAEQYAAGTNCHTNTECNANCMDGTWTIQQYYTANCVPQNGRYQPSDPKQIKACETVGGLVRRTWKRKYNDACYANMFYKSIFAAYVTADAAKDAVGCKDDTVFAE